MSVQDQVHEKNIALVIKGGKLTAKILAKAMKKFLSTSKQPGKNAAAQKSTASQGKQTVKQLTRQGAGVSKALLLYTALQ